MSVPHESAEFLPPNQQLAAPGKWPVVGEKAPRQDDAPWTVSATGLVAQPHVWTLDELQALPQETHLIDIHCVTRWSKPQVAFTGVPLRVLLEQVSPLPTAQFVSFVARSERGHSTSLPLVDALLLDTMIAFAADGKPLEEIHGAPVRTVVPGRYFYKSLKWLETLELLAEDRLGYWESEAGYHNVADPWREERYIAPNLDRNALRLALTARNFRGQDFRSVSAAGFDLAGLNAERALLRDADFRRANLARSNFTGANLSNAHLQLADLRDAVLRDADLEGADFRGADLRGADLRGASLFGATFCPEPPNAEAFSPAILDRTTQILPDALGKLTPHQQDFVRQAIAGSIFDGV
jgi:DMSO/TMAO reductase YedYZ molybdopterin-dependent catalytic subunit